MTGRGRAAGFTLAELVAVVLVMGIAAAATIPALRRPDERGAGAAADALQAVYAEARSASARRGEPVLVVLETATDSFAVFAEPAEGVPRLLRAGALPMDADGRIAGGSGGRAHARFTPRGRAWADRVVLSDGDARHEVTVDPWTGTARRARP